MHRRRVERQPARVALGGVVAVLVAIADRGDRAPRVVVELGIPMDDEAIGEAHGHQREQASVIGEVEALANRNLGGSLIPSRTQVGLRPEAYGVGLSVGALDALCSTKVLGFVVIACVKGARQWRRGARPALASPPPRPTPPPSP